MCSKSDVDVKKIVKFIDFIYLNNFINNTLKNNNNYELFNDEEIYQFNTDWKIFSTQYINDSYNILYFIKILSYQTNYKQDILLTTIHIYSKICVKYAHLINNYTYLFVSVYVATYKVLCDDNLTHHFMANILSIPDNIAMKMINIVDNFMYTNDIYFGSKEKKKLISDILYN